MEGATKASADQIERELGELLDQETFDPPEDFVRNALIKDESVYEEAARDPRRGGPSRPRRSTGSRPGTTCWTSPRPPSTSGSPAAS